MRLLFLLSSLHGGGAERVAATLANAWVRRGIEVRLVCCYSGRGSNRQSLDDRVQIQWLVDQMPPGPGFMRPLAKLRALRRLVRGYEPDRVLSFLTNVNVTALLATWGLDVPVVVSERSDPLYGRSAGPLLRALRRFTYPRAARVVVQTETGRQHLRQVVPAVRHCVVIANPLPPGLPPPRHAEPPAERLLLAAVGRFNPVKQFDRLIEVFATLAVAHPRWDLVIWGDGPQRDACQARVRALGLEARVQLPGYRQQIWAALSQAHAFILCSRVEGFPNALLEAMALGLPCVATDCPSGPADLTREGRDADLVPWDDEAAWARALDRLMRASPQARTVRGLAGADAVRARYGLDAILARWDAQGLAWSDAHHGPEAGHG
ncbi:glycosyltransferase family 4 protein [Castellaniella sp.]|uniref:glycosyltransferase family 4 protein n=1 Tax=Castellaniella sp. TaxID=1955812 RepID=UPI0035659428